MKNFLGMAFRVGLCTSWLFLVPKGPSTHDEEFAGEYSTNIRQQRISSFFIFLRNSIFMKFFDLLVCFRKFYIF